MHVIYVLGYQGASRPSSVSTFNSCLIFQHSDKTKINVFFADLLFFVIIRSKIYKNLKFLETTFVILSIHKPSLGSCKVLHKIIGSAVSTCIEFKRTEKQIDKQSKYIYQYILIHYINVYLPIN